MIINQTEKTESSVNVIMNHPTQNRMLFFLFLCRPIFTRKAPAKSTNNKSQFLINRNIVNRNSNASSNRNNLKFLFRNCFPSFSFFFHYTEISPFKMRA